MYNIRVPKPPPTNTVLSIANLPPKAVAVFDAWMLKEGYSSRRAAFVYLAKAMSGDRLLVLDRPTKEILVGAAKGETLVEARRAAREEARIVLWEEGFIADPGTCVVWKEGA
jgi:hypothetical protein